MIAAQARDTLQSHAAKVCIAMAILLTHAIVFSALSRSDSVLQPKPEERRPSVAWVQVDDMDRRDTTPLPELQLVTPEEHLVAPTVLRFEDLDDDAAVVGSYSAPRLSRVQGVSPEAYARKAGVSPRHPVTVVLAILVQENGAVGDVRVVRSSGSDTIDAAALEYAKTVHWIPGTQDQKPQSMRITFPVVLSVGEG